MLGGMLGTVTGSFAGGVASSDPAHGVVRPGDFAVTQNGTPNMSVNVAAGGAFIRGTQNANQGAYHVWNDGTVNLPISAADVTNGRRDLVIAQVRDSAYSGADDDARITVVTGTPAAVPADPSLASFPNALVLARITVAAGDTAINTGDITDLRTIANVRNSIPTFATYTERTTAIPSPYNGQLSAISAGWVADGIEQYNGVAWRQPWNMPWGLVATANSTAGTASVTTTETVQLTSSSYTALASRYYKATFTTTFVGNVAGDLCQVQLRRDNAAGTSFGAERVTIPLNPFQTFYCMTLFFTTTAGAQTVCATLQRIAGSGSAYSGAGLQSQIIVEDIGPAGAPALPWQNTVASLPTFERVRA